jgi:tricorn protease
MRQTLQASLLASLTFIANAVAAPGYYRQPTVSADTVVFVAEGDLWKVGLAGGAAHRLTTNLAEESFPRLSPDGKLVAFTARYEGPAEVYVMPVTGGLPTRLTHDGDGTTRVQGWTPDGQVLYASARWSGKPDTRMYAVHPTTRAVMPLPLSQAAEGCYLGGDFIFTRLPLMSDNVKNYKGGLRQSLWRLTQGAKDGSTEATAFAAQDSVTRQPMCATAAKRVYFVSERDGTMNLWSVNATGSDLKQHTRHRTFDIRNANISADGARVVYQRGADVHMFETASGEDRVLNISLQSDFEHLRTRWVKNPWDYVTSVAPSPTGDRVAITVRGEVVVLPVGNGRRIPLLNNAAQRARSAHFSADGKNVFAFTDSTGEFELTRLPANGVGTTKTLTQDAKVLRIDMRVSPDGKSVLHHDKARNLYLTDVASGSTKVIDRSPFDDYSSIVWSPDSRYVVVTKQAANQFERLTVVEIATGKATVVTSDRYDARDAAFSPDGKWLFFIANRNLQSLVTSPWGQRNPSPYFDRQSRLYAYALDPTARWPFLPRDELTPAAAAASAPPSTPAPDPKPAPAGEAKPEMKAEAKPADKPSTGADKKPESPARASTNIVFEGLTERLYEVPVPVGNYDNLSTDGKRLYFTVSDPAERKTALRSVAIEAPNPAPPSVDTFFEDIRSYQLTQDRKKILLRRNNDLFVFDAGKSPPPPPEQGKFQVNTRDWMIELDPKREWQQMFDDAWRMHRDFFYDANLHGADWPAARKRYQPLLARATDRAEVADAIAQMIAEVRALHSQVGPGDIRTGSDTVAVGALGADVTRVAEGFRIDRLMEGDTELIEERSPLGRAEVAAKVGDVITAINGKAASSAATIGELLRQQVGAQVLVSLASADGKKRDMIVTPVSAQRDRELRYLQWERERKERAEKLSDGRIGYVHLQAMGPNDIARWAREFYPVFQREGLIIDLRNNNGGSIDSWIIEKLQRRAWHFWQQRYSAQTFHNQQLAFRGHVVAIIDANTYSDGETLAQGLRRLGIATLVGTTTAGAGIWLSDQNRLRDNGIARAAEFGSFVDHKGERAWITEGVGVAPDVMVDNLPAATYRGEDAQLLRAVEILREKMAKEPMTKPQLPAFPVLGK